MNTRGLLMFRTVVACALGIWCLLAASVSGGALLPAALRSRPGVVVFVAIFGVGWILQAAYLLRQRRVRP